MTRPQERVYSTIKSLSCCRGKCLRASAFWGIDQIAAKIQHKARAVPSGPFSSVWHDLASLDEVVKGGTGNVQDLGN